NILVIPGLSGVMSDEGVLSDKELVYKDAQFYLISVAVFVLTFSFALIYNPDTTANGVNTLTGTMTRPLALIPIALYLLYVFIQQQEVSDTELEDPPDDLRVGRQWGLLALSLILVVVGVEGLVRAALFFGDTTGIPPFVWGITVLAGVTSVPDALISIRLARRGEGVVSLSNVLGSNIFDLLIAVPAGVLIAGSVAFQFAVAVPLIGFLTLATIVLFAQLRTGLELSKLESWLLLVAYGAFVVWMILEQIGLMSLLPPTPTG
ncbi:MAG: sodium:calcium antiporter, partial [Acidimicrobiia bacterium]|nr:sodium:calcium antiporter [Acidimicrobiia bacterium]